MMNINSKQPKTEYDALLNTKSSVVDAMSVMLNVQSKVIQVRRSKIKDVARGLAEIAYSMGQTNDPDEFAEEMTENIYSAFKKVKEKQTKKKKKG